jgi:hypothetical protein
MNHFVSALIWIGATILGAATGAVITGFAMWLFLRRIILTGPLEDIEIEITVALYFSIGAYALLTLVFIIVSFSGVSLRTLSKDLGIMFPLQVVHFSILFLFFILVRGWLISTLHIDEPNKALQRTPSRHALLSHDRFSSPLTLTLEFST